LKRTCQISEINKIYPLYKSGGAVKAEIKPFEPDPGNAGVGNQKSRPVKI